MTHIIDAAKSLSGRTEWRIDSDGCLTEVGPHSMKFTLNAQGTRLLLLLLERQKDVILAGASLEQKT
jgi:hypothetical protein